jgi:hypothetical protein
VNQNLQMWDEAIGHLRRAQVERDVMRDREAPQPARDLACARYTVAVDALVVALERLSERQVLGALRLELARRGRA